MVQGSGSQNTLCFVQQKAVAVKVSGDMEIIIESVPFVEFNLKDCYHRCCQLSKISEGLSWQH